MHRSYVDPEKWTAAVIELSADESHHLIRVLRAGVSDVITVFDGRGRSAQAKIETVNPVTVSLIDTPAVDAQASYQVSLIQALPKGKTMDLIVEKATELGASEIFPILTERVVKRPDAEKALHWSERWQKVALSAARQCGVNIVPVVHPVTDCNDLMGACPDFDVLLLGSLEDNVAALSDVISETRNDGPKGRPLKVGLMIGPEGDFSEQESKVAISAGATPVSFGKLVLRVETAAIYGLSILAYEYLNGEAAVSEGEEG